VRKGQDEILRPSKGGSRHIRIVSEGGGKTYKKGHEYAQRSCRALDKGGSEDTQINGKDRGRGKEEGGGGKRSPQTSRPI